MKYIELSQGRKAMVDDDMYEYLNQWKWSAVFHHNNWYAVRTQWIPLKRIKMHQLIMNFPKGTVDHKNGNGLDNQKKNLRVATSIQSQQNRGKQSNNASGYKGVSCDRKRYRVRIKYLTKYIHVGYFDNLILAAKAYDKAAKKYHGEFARLNFPEQGE